MEKTKLETGFEVYFQPYQTTNFLFKDIQTFGNSDIIYLYIFVLAI